MRTFNCLIQTLQFENDITIHFTASINCDVAEAK